MLSFKILHQAELLQCVVSPSREAKASTTIFGSSIKALAKGYVPHSGNTGELRRNENCVCLPGKSNTPLPLCLHPFDLNLEENFRALSAFPPSLLYILFRYSLFVKRIGTEKCSSFCKRLIRRGVFDFFSPTPKPVR
ncbi:hypothetical protein CDAR_570171 [Caerostris darwini]|uniref:Uncharacterized protein n=1 Tax=Caerostris darwini TaxID=1538125 RepID=A0AAV4RZV2_9ARAC|nr:hypothetical protein CDAR_570171 [Caerostris darwini]